MDDSKTVAAPSEQPERTPEEIDLEKRYRGFNEELIPLLAKYKLGLGAVPLVVPNQQGGGFSLAAKPQLFDDSKSQEKKPAPENVPTDQSRADAPVEEPKKESDSGLVSA